MNKKSICKRCIIDLDALTGAGIASQIESIPQAERTPAAEYDERTGICRKCKHLMGATCSQCGSFAEVRAAWINMQCPIGCWQSYKLQPAEYRQ